MRTECKYINNNRKYLKNVFKSMNISFYALICRIKSYKNCFNPNESNLLLYLKIKQLYSGTFFSGFVPVFDSVEKQIRVQICNFM